MYQKQSGEYGRVCNAGDSHRNKAKQCSLYIYSRWCLFCDDVVVHQRSDMVIFTLYARNVTSGEQHIQTVKHKVFIVPALRIRYHLYFHVCFS